MRNEISSFVIADPTKCVGCRTCELACFTVHNSKNETRYTVGTVKTPVIPRLFLVKDEDFAMPVQCRHCEDAPCANSCPVNAIKKADNAIIVDEKLCIGCKTCILACPFGALELLPEYNEAQEVQQYGLEEPKKIAYKGDLCSKMDGYACIEACPKDALSLVEPALDKKTKNLKAALSILETMKNL